MIAQLRSNILYAKLYTLISLPVLLLLPETKTIKLLSFIVKYKEMNKKTIFFIQQLRQNFLFCIRNQAPTMIQFKPKLNWKLIIKNKSYFEILINIIIAYKQY